MKTNNVIFFVLLSGLLLIVGCIGGNKDKTLSDIHMGFDGVNVEFIKGTPPPNIFEKSSFPVGLIIKNDGAYSVNYKSSPTTKTTDESAVLILNVEEDYNCVDAFDGSGNFFAISNDVNKCSINKNSIKKIKFGIDGKTEFNPKGYEEIVMFNVITRQLEPQSESHSSSLYATLCYPYETRFTDTACIDTDILGARFKQKVCKSEDKDYPKGQGAPIAVTRVESRMLDKDNKIIPNFIIHIENRGNGNVIKRRNDAQETTPTPPQATQMSNIDEVCSSKRLDPADRDFNTVALRAYLGAETQENQLYCEPKKTPEDTGKEGYVRLVGNKDIIRCSLPEDKSVKKNTQPYTSPLIIILDYGYMSSISAKYVIERSVVE